MATERKTEVGPVDGTPEKRLFWSIISDYDLKTGVCELIDNALDLWTITDRRKPIRVALELNADRQLLSIVDTAGGVKQEELRLLIAPGGSRNNPRDRVIGIFGVGSKRAGVALGERVRIRTRFGRGSTFEIEINKEWLESASWEIPVYEVPDISSGTTQVEISHLRKPFSSDDIVDLELHLSETYAWFLEQGCVLELNGVRLVARHFEHWSYPPAYPPQSVSFEADLGETEQLTVAFTAGLIGDRVPEQDNYGVYFYCNHRLIAKELRTREVGYITGQAGIPHSDASLCRVIVKLEGAAKLMPWNSSKSGINSGHLAFERIRPTLFSLVTHYSSLSRRLRNDWDKYVLRFTSGRIVEVPPDEVASGRKLVLPPLPRVNKAKVEQLKSLNKKRLQEQPWTLGLIEAIAAVDTINRQRFETKNRIALVLLDSNLEIGLKEFIVHRPDLFPVREFDDQHIANLFKNRSRVMDAVLAHVDLGAAEIGKIKHYYALRNKLIHERATVGVTDADVSTYRTSVERVLRLLFKIRF